VPTSTSPLEAVVVRPLLLERARVLVEVVRVRAGRGELEEATRRGELAELVLRRGLAAAATGAGCSGLGVVSSADVLSSR
jgi:hypothetical protein